jgi:4-amino-4-deoxy-L-arabinose transferase
MLTLLIAGAIVIPWQWYIHSYFPTEAETEQIHQWAHLFEVLDNQGGEWYYFLNKLRINYGELIYLPLICFFIFYKKWHNHVWLAFATIIFVPLLFFSSVATKMQGYILFIAPFLFLVTAWFISFLKEFKWSKKTSSIPTVALIVFSLIAVRYGVERIKPTEQFDIPQWKADILDIKEKYGNKSVAVFNSKRPVETMFYTSYLAFSRKPSSLDIKVLHSKNYEVVVLKD